MHIKFLGKENKHLKMNHLETASKKMLYNSVLMLYMRTILLQKYSI